MNHTGKRTAEEWERGMERGMGPFRAEVGLTAKEAEIVAAGMADFLREHDLEQRRGRPWRRRLSRAWRALRGDY